MLIFIVHKKEPDYRGISHTSLDLVTEWENQHGRTTIKVCSCKVSTSTNLSLRPVTEIVIDVFSKVLIFLSVGFTYNFMRTQNRLYQDFVKACDLN